MKQGIFTIVSNTHIADSFMKMVLDGDVSAITVPGQFVNIALDGLFLRRPVSVCDVCDGKLTLIYKTVGEGTEKMSRMTCGDTLDLLSGLGNGYNTDICGESPLLVGGGAGVPPLFYLCRKLTDEGKKVTVILGFNKKSEIIMENDFRALGVDVTVTTADGSYGVHGFVTNALPMCGRYTYFYTCGPVAMMKALFSATLTSGQFSFEERMGCGFGACMGCTCETNFGNKRVCRDGPVFEKEEIKW